MTYLFDVISFINSLMSYQMCLFGSFYISFRSIFIFTFLSSLIISLFFNMGK